MKSKKNSRHDPVPTPSVTDPVLDQKEYEERSIREYVYTQTKNETVKRLEKIKTEVLFEDRYDIWDVETTRNRYWVITSPTNLYSQRDFKSLDYTLSFHIGVTMRVAAHQHRELPEREADKSPMRSPLRRLSQAIDALDNAREAEDFQAVGMRCRECLLDLIHHLATPSMIPPATPEPKKSDFLNWSKFIAQYLTPGEGSARIRAYVISASSATWELVAWLTHARSAVRQDAEFAIGATENVVHSFANLLRKTSRGAPLRCPNCGSYKLYSDYRSDTDSEVWVCEVCDWSQQSKDPDVRGASPL